MAGANVRKPAAALASAQYQQACTPKAAWRRVVESVIEMRAALEYRIWREDPDDTQLEPDVRNWRALTQALGDLLNAKRPAR